MKSVIYHTGLTPPPSCGIGTFEISYCPVLRVDYEICNDPQNITDILKQNPIILMMSKNAVIGLDKWLTTFSLKPDFFGDANFWTVGDRTHDCLENILGFQSFYPNEMTGKGVIKVLRKQKHPKVLLISGQNLRHEFIVGLSSSGINFFHFPVYKITCIENPGFSAHFNDAESNYLIITSPSSVDGILKNLSLSNLSTLKVRIISIGPTTSEEIHKKGGEVFIESKIQNINALNDKIDSLIIETSHL